MKTVKTVKETKKAKATKTVTPVYIVDLVGITTQRDVYARFAIAKINAGLALTENEQMCIISAIVEEIENNAVQKFIRDNNIVELPLKKEGFFKRLQRGLKYAFNW